jgi:hypothetical protein
MSFIKKSRQLTLPVIICGSFIGAVQDLLSPLLKFGVLAGVVLIIFSFLLFLTVKEDSKLGIAIRNHISGHWKTPLVISTFLVGSIVIVASYFTTQSRANEGNGVLADNVKFIKVLQADLLGIKESLVVIEKEVTEIKVITKDTNETVNETQQNVSEILINTQRTAADLLQDKGYKSNDYNDFYKAIDVTSVNELAEVLTLFKLANFKLNQKISVYPYLFADDNEMNQKLLRLPKASNPLHGMFYRKFPFEKLMVVLTVFKDQQSLITPTADLYAWQSINPMSHALPNVIVFHPQPNLNFLGGSFNWSLISYKLKRDNKLTEQRGAYNLLHTAAALGDLPLVMQLIKMGFDTSSKTHTGYTPLTLAIENGHTETSAYLLEYDGLSRDDELLALEILLLKSMDGYYPANSGTSVVGQSAYPEWSDNTYLKQAKALSKRLGNTKAVTLPIIAKMKKQVQLHEADKGFGFTKLVSVGKQYLKQFEAL